MNFPISSSVSKTTKKAVTTTPPKIPRIESLLHRLQRAKDAKGKPSQLLDELMFLLDDPPPGLGDRWQKGAHLCEEHGIKTSRMSVWRLYRAHILEWRREQNPPPPEPPPTPEETARLHDLACHLAAQRILDMLNDPGLSPGHLIGLLQNDNQRRKIELARDQFNDRLTERARAEKRQYYKRIEEEAREKAMAGRMETLRKTFLAPEVHTTSYQSVTEHSPTPGGP